MDEQPDIDLDFALVELGLQDPRLATLAGAAIRVLTGDGGLEALTQQALQSFVWYELPCEYGGTAETKLALVAALGRLFERLGMSRYAGVCASPTTAAVVRAYAKGVNQGLAAYRRAEDRSGVRPPHLPELVWGRTMGSVEASAFQSTAAALELAVAAGLLRPSVRGWRRLQQELAWQHLTAPHPEFGGRAWIAGVYAERFAYWLHGRSPARTRLVGAVAEEVLACDGPVPGTARALAPLCWVLSRALDGLALTARGNWSRALVAEVAERFGWWPYPRPPRGEHEVDRVRRLHRLLAQLGALRRVGRREELTWIGRALQQDSAILWRVIARHLGLGLDFDAHLRELVFAALLAEPSVDTYEVVHRVRRILADEGWRDHHGQLEHEAAYASFGALLQLALPLGMFDERAWPDDLRLTVAGRGLALEALRVRATAPREVHLCGP
jgi:hypothetical protein